MRPRSRSSPPPPRRRRNGRRRPQSQRASRASPSRPDAQTFKREGPPETGGLFISKSGVALPPLPYGLRACGFPGGGGGAERPSEPISLPYRDGGTDGSVSFPFGSSGWGKTQRMAER